MSAAGLLMELNRLNIHVSLDGDDLRCSAAAGAMTPDIRNRILQRRSEIVEFLRRADALEKEERAIVPLQTGVGRTPVFALSGHKGDVFAFRRLVQHLGPSQPFFGLQPPGGYGEEPIRTVGELAAYFAERIRAFHPEGPVAIAGYCSGGPVAFEIARQLRNSGASISFVALIAAPYPTWFEAMRRPGPRMMHKLGGIGRHARAIAALEHEHRVPYVRRLLNRLNPQNHDEPDQSLLHQDRIGSATLDAVRKYRPVAYSGYVGLLLPSVRCPASMRAWLAVAQDAEEYFGPKGSHADMMLSEPHVSSTAEMFRRCYRNAELRLRSERQ